MLTDQPYRYLTVDEMKSLGDDSLPIDVTKDERMDSNKESFGECPSRAGSKVRVWNDVVGFSGATGLEETISPQYVRENYAQFNNYAPDNVDIARQPVNVG